MHRDKIDIRMRLGGVVKVQGSRLFDVARVRNDGQPKAARKLVNRLQLRIVGRGLGTVRVYLYAVDIAEVLLDKPAQALVGNAAVDLQPQQRAQLVGMALGGADGLFANAVLRSAQRPRQALALAVVFGALDAADERKVNAVALH